MGLALIIKDVDYSESNIGTVSLVDEDVRIEQIVNAYIALVGNTYYKQVKNLVSSLVYAGIFDKFVGLYPMIGNTAEAIGVNLIDVTKHTLKYPGFAVVGNNKIIMAATTNGASFTHPEITEGSYPGINSAPIFLFMAHKPAYTQMNICTIGHDFSTSNKKFRIENVWTSPDVKPTAYLGGRSVSVDSDGYLSDTYINTKQGVAIERKGDNIYDVTHFVNNYRCTNRPGTAGASYEGNCYFDGVVGYNYLDESGDTVVSKYNFYVGDIYLYAFGRLSAKEAEIAVQAINIFLDSVKGI